MFCNIPLEAKNSLQFLKFKVKYRLVAILGKRDILFEESDRGWQHDYYWHL